MFSSCCVQWKLVTNVEYTPKLKASQLFEDTVSVGGYPRKISRLKKFRALVVPGGRCRKGIIIQVRQIKCRFSYGRPVIPEKKRGCNRSVCPCTHTEE